MSPTAPHQALYRRWRAQTFGQIVGQDAVVETLRNAARLDQVSHALLFVGPRGTGKTSMARIVAKAVNCTDLRDGEPCDRCPACTSIREGRTLDLVEIDAASNRGIEDVRALRESLPYAPSELRRKVYVLDEAHQITKDAWNALLKSIEEPPEHVTFIFASTNPAGFPPAILSRVQRFDFRRLTVPQIEGKLRMILEADGRSAEPEAIELVARLAAGGMRDAESMLDQLLSSGAERLTAEQVRGLLGLAEAESVEAFVDALVRGDALAGIAVLDELDDRGRDVRTFLDQVVDAVREGLVAALGGRTARSGAPAAGPAGLGAAGRRLAAIDPAGGGPGGLRFQLELALLASSSSEPVAPAAGPEIAAPAAGPATIAAPPVRPAAAARPATATGAPDHAAPGRGADRPVHQAAARPTRRAPSSSEGAPAATVPEPMPVAVGPGDGAGEATLAELRRVWPEIVGHISEHPPTKPLIAVCRPIAVDGDVVTLGFPEEQSFLKDVAERRREILEEGVGRYLGRPVLVRCVATNLDVVAPLPGGDEAARLLDEARRIFADDLLDVGEIG